LHIATAQAGESEIQHNRTRPPCFHVAEGRNPVIDGDNAIPRRTECCTVEFTQVAVVFDDQDVLLS
jgi:hypothetical protein